MTQAQRTLTAAIVVAVLAITAAVPVYAAPKLHFGLEVTIVFFSFTSWADAEAQGLNFLSRDYWVLSHTTCCRDTEEIPLGGTMYLVTITARVIPRLR